MIPPLKENELDYSPNSDHYRMPIDPPEMELLAQQIITQDGNVLKAYKCASIDPLKYPMYKEWADLPPKVKGRVHALLRKCASQTVADRKEILEFLTKIIRDDPSLASRSDRKRLDTLDAVKELCKVSGYYSPVEIKNTHEIVVPDSIRRMSNEQLAQIASQAKGEVIDVQAEVAALPSAEPTPSEG